MKKQVLLLHINVNGFSIDSGSILANISKYSAKAAAIITIIGITTNVPS